MGIEQIDDFMAAIRQIESSGNYQAVSPSGNHTGAYQISHSLWGGYQGYARAMDAPPAVQDERARQLMIDYYRAYGDWGAVAVAWHAGPGDGDGDGVTNIEAYFAGTLNTEDSLGTGTADTYVPRVLSLMGIDTGDTGAGGGAVAEATKLKIPGGGELLRTLFLPVIRFEVFPGVFVDFIVGDDIDLAGSGYDIGSAGLFYEPDGQLVPAADSGFASELAPLFDEGYNDVQSWMSDTLGQLFSPNNPVWDDPQVQRIWAEWLANPETDPAIIMGRIRNDTDYWQQINQRQTDWFEASEAEQKRLTDEQAALIADSFWQLTGTRPPITDAEVQEWATMVASGQWTMGQINDRIRTRALENPESPYARTLRSEDEEQRQRGVDIENNQTLIRDTALNWGVEMTDQAIAEWATGIAENRQSLDDFTQWMKGQAQILYPWKDPEVATIDAARSWLTAKSTILETGEVSLFDDDIQQALQSGTSLADFRKRLRSDPRWKDTDNFQRTAGRPLADINEQFGFA